VELTTDAGRKDKDCFLQSEEVKEKLTDRRANCTINGFQFQTVAAISLLIDHLYDFQSIKNEGEDDIVVRLSNEKVICAQAKSSSDENSKNALDYLKKSFESLSDDMIKFKTNCSQLVYITNINSMFGNTTIVDDFPSGITVSYNEFSQKNKELVKKYAPTSFGIDIYGVQFLKYIGDDEKKETWIRSKLERKLSDRKTLKLLNPDCVFDTWKKYLDYNAGNKSSAVCNKKRIVWGMILHKIDRIEQSISAEDSEDYSDVSIQYSKFITRCSERFELISRISGNYEICRSETLFKSHTSDISDKLNYSPTQFTKDHWKDYKDLVSEMDLEPIIEEKLLKVIIQTILQKFRLIEGVKAEMGI